MRDIEFRGRTKSGKWVFGDLIGFQNVRGIIQEEDYTYSDDGGALDFSYTPVIPETVGQYTGKRDKKRTKEFPEGQKIFAGDIVKRDPDGMWGVVVWSEAGMAFLYDLQNGRKVFTNAWSSITVIGNVTDNPDLLEAK